jgi:uncharacterized protein YigE (DUF2233 family)
MTDFFSKLFLVVMGCSLIAFGARAADRPPQELQNVSYGGARYLVRTVDPKKEDLRFYWKDDQGNDLKDFAGLDKYVASKGEHLVFAANAGMFDPTSKPVGLLVQNGNEESPLNLADGTGNFYMKPNGVFLINDKHEARVIESSDYSILLSPTIWATQSGPLMVYGGNIHPDFIDDSKNMKIRSGVGLRKDGTIVFAISRGQVNFYDFAAFFLNDEKCPDALFLDGVISTFYVPGQKDDMPHSFGPMFGLVVKE